MEMWNVVLELDADRDAAAGELGDRLIEEYGVYHPVVTVSNIGRLELVLSLPAEGFTQAIATGVALARDLPVTRFTIDRSVDFDRRGEVEVPPLLSVTEVADRCGVTRAAVQKRIDKGALPAVRVGAGWVIPEAAV